MRHLARFSRIFLALLWPAIVGGSASAQDTPRLPAAPKHNLPPASKPTDKLPGTGVTGAGAIIPRISVNQYELPWSAVGRLRGGRASCTGSLIGPSLLLTAAHCVYDPATQRLFPAQDLHFMLGYAEGRYVAEAHGTRLTVSGRYDPTQGINTMGEDWALLELDQPIGTPDRVLPLRPRRPVAGDVVTLGGYAQERIEVLMVDAQCHVMGAMRDKNGVSLIRHDCTATHGVSGAPLLMQEGNQWVIAGIEVVGAPQAGGGAAVLDDVRAAMAKIAMEAGQKPPLQPSR